MCQVRKCCCVFSLKMGSMIAAAYTIVLGLIGVAFSAWLLTDGIASAEELIKIELRKEYPNDEQTIDKLADSALRLLKITYIITLVIYAVWLFSGILIFAAVTTKKRGFLLPWVIMTSVLIGFAIIAIVNTVWKFIRDKVLSGTDLYSAVVVGLTVTGNLIAMCVVKSYYKNRCREEDEVNNPQSHGMDRLAYKKCAENEMI